MIDPAIAALDFVGFIGFLTAFVYSYKNFQKTCSLSAVWLLYTVAMAFLAVFTFIKFLKWVDIYPLVMETIEHALFPVAIVSIFTAVLLSHEEFLKLISK